MRTVFIVVYFWEVVGYDQSRALYFYKQHSVVSLGDLFLARWRGKRNASALGNTNKAFVLENHGLLGVGQTVDEATYRHIIMEQSCQGAMTCGSRQCAVV